ncbi:MAG: hypothetical protein ACOCRX_02475 [Candidatus Woesearchaeota archaeon]
MVKKADISINVVVITAIALIVLVVLIAIFTGEMGNFTEGLDSTTEDFELMRSLVETSGIDREGFTSCDDFYNELVSKNVISKKGSDYFFRSKELSTNNEGNGVCFNIDENQCCFELVSDDDSDVIETDDGTIIG